MKKNITRRSIVLCITLLLASCTGAPGADDLRPLIEQNIRDSLQGAQTAVRSLGGDQGVDFMRALGAPDPQEVAIENVKVLESRALDNGDYEIALRYDLVAGDSRRIKTTTVRVDKVDGRWRLLPG